MYTTFQPNHHLFWGIYVRGTLVNQSPSQRNLYQLSSAQSQLTNPTAKYFLRGLKNCSSKVPDLGSVMNSATLPFHTAWTTVWSSGLCGVSHCHGWWWWWCQCWAILSSFFKNFSQSVQCVAAALIVSHLGRNLGLS